ncbi:MAG TPA: metallophosphoesterase [Minicystis sp.]|nr:metallophosphoesterase [Minicystis sp.]
MTTLAHVTDLHLIEDDYRSRAEPERRRLEVLTFGRKKDPKARRLRAAAALRAAWETGADHLVVTGDLTEDGVDAQFGVVAEVLDASPWPAPRVTLVPGNHDAYADGNAFERALDGPLARFAATSRPGAVTVLPGALLVAVSTSTAQSYGRATGSIRDAAFGAMARAAELAARTGRAAVIAMHHAPFGHAFAPLHWIDGLREHARMLELLRGHDALYVLHGHTHEARDAAVRAGGTPRVFSARAAVEDPGAARTYEARFGRLAPSVEPAGAARMRLAV